MRVIESIQLEEATLSDLSDLVADLIKKHGSDAMLFWYSERFSKDCYLVVHKD